MAKRKKRRKRTISEKVMLVLGILIALSMISALIAGLGSGKSLGRAPLTIEWGEYDSVSVFEEGTSLGGPVEGEIDDALQNAALQNAAHRNAID